PGFRRRWFCVLLIGAELKVQDRGAELLRLDVLGSVEREGNVHGKPPALARPERPGVFPRMGAVREDRIDDVERRASCLVGRDILEVRLSLRIEVVDLDGQLAEGSIAAVSNLP